MRFLPALLLVLAGALRLPGMVSHDLFCDEALAAEIADALYGRGQLNNFTLSDFVAAGQFKAGVWRYFPPLFYVLSGPLYGLKGVLHPNLLPRLPSFLASLALGAGLYRLTREFLGGPRVALVCLLLFSVNALQIQMSQVALPYSLLPALLTFTLHRLLRAGD